MMHGDFNFTLGRSKIWCTTAIQDALSKFFVGKLEDKGL
jgi:hypothetical protein